MTGTGQAMGAPDVAYLELGVDIANNDLGEAMAEASDHDRGPRRDPR